MRKHQNRRTTMAATMVVTFLLVSGGTAAAHHRPDHAGGPPKPGTTPVEGILYDQWSWFEPSSGLTSNLYADDIYADTEGADDFEVPRGRSWRITQVNARGFWTTSGVIGLLEWNTASTLYKLSPPTFNVTIYSDNGGLPGPVLASFKDLQGPTEMYAYGNETNFAFRLPEEVTLGEGRYWLSVQQNTSTGRGHWYWGIFWGSGSNLDAAWRSPAGNHNGECVEWATGCFGSYNHMFRIEGFTDN